jgi:hypothetical protein
MPQILLPSRYIAVLASLPTREVSFGAGGLRLFASNEIESAQIGYAIDQKGKPLDGWKSEWLVIGDDTGMGDPLIVDVADSELAVFTSMSGDGIWNLHQIAVSIDAFATCFREFGDLAQGRSNPIEAKKNPLGDAQKEAYLARTAGANGKRVETEFWEALLAYVD